MRPSFLVGAFYLAFAAWAMPVNAQNAPRDLLWKDMRPWYVFYQPDFSGCIVINLYAREKHFRVGYEGVDKSHYILFTARNGPELPYKKTSEVFLIFEPGDRVLAYVSGERVGKSEIWPALLFRAVAADIRQRLARANRLRIEYEREIVADIDLTGLGSAMAEFDACNKAKASK